jgi:transposase
VSTSKPWEHGDEHAACREKIQAQEARIEELLDRVEKLEEEVRQLRSRLNRDSNSRNSSRPPSSDSADAPPRPGKPPTGRRPGGQPGHPGHRHPLVDPSKVKRIVDVKPTQCKKCGRRLRGHDPDPWRHQVAEIPPVEPQVNEFRMHQLC